MRLSMLLFLPVILSVSSALPPEENVPDSDFEAIWVQEDMSGIECDPPEKFFHESTFHPHYDRRYADHELEERERGEVLTNLIQTYLATMSDIGAETWIMHGSLLGWWWNRKILPWDTDLDVQITEATLSYLASFYNMTSYYYQSPRIPDGREYVLEVNPHYVDRSQLDSLNVIDARWVDTKSGLFIDITAVSYDSDTGLLECKDGHQYYKSEIFPLRDTYFEGTAAKIPFMYKRILEDEYTPSALTATTFEDHVFNEATQEWVPILEGLDDLHNESLVSPHVKPLVDPGYDLYIPEQDQQTQYIYHPEDIELESDTAPIGDEFTSRPEDIESESESDTTPIGDEFTSRAGLNHEHISSIPMAESSTEQESVEQGTVSEQSQSAGVITRSEDEDMSKALETALGLQKKAERIESRCKNSRICY